MPLRLINLLVLSLLTSGPLLAKELQLTSGEYSIAQTWSQETGFQRQYFVQVPDEAGQQKLPVFIFLHGNGGNAKGAMNGFLRRHKQIAATYITVFANGYGKSWNIVSERSKADDRGFVEGIVKHLASYGNVQQGNFTIMGSSNGAALVNQIAIESQLANVRNYISAVSPLNSFQHDGTNFKAKGDDNNYETVAHPMTGKRLMNISGTDDELVPYHGGPSKHIPAKGGKLGFVDAEGSIFLWARRMGYDGVQLSEPSWTNGKLAVYSYLGGDIVHVKVMGEGHGATRAVDEQMLLRFLQAKSGDVTKEETHE